MCDDNSNLSRRRHINRARARRTHTMATNAFMSTWEAEQHRMHQRNGALTPQDERAGPTALVLNLAHLPVAGAVASIEAGGPDAAKDHQGVRVTVVVLRMLSAGFSSVQVSTAPL